MISAKLIKTDDEFFACDNENCQHSLDFHYYDEEDKLFYIKINISCILIHFDKYTLEQIYCPDCMKIIYQQFKAILDPKLRPFL